MACITVNVGELPQRSSEDFRSSNIDGVNLKSLPSPCEVRLQAVHQRAVRIGQNPADAFRPAPVCFRQDDLLVKWGADVTIAEGQCLWFFNRYLQDRVPVPRIYGWTQDQGQTFLYMQLISGDPLSKRWDSLSPDEKLSISEQLKSMVATWQGLKRHDCPASNQPLLSQLGGQALRDIMFHDGENYPAGPFESVREFNDAFARLAHPTAAVDDIDPRKTFVELRGLTDDRPAVFAHADLDLSNILTSKIDEGSARVKAIIDWHQAGWYPQYWDWLKAQSVGQFGSEWVEHYLPKFLQLPPDEYHEAFEYVSMALI
ncbi:hypothetical protein KC363_g886 [Hortaea werneckii]|uniref:Aminoglycoside phosphotransferase domain-containing protein n=1 Tax=Hortaea werneckii TaxID=91943 RepID=A0A3M7G341_HORWE|nr:hypothetical protein KC363_g886 [Hortaea werneckii]KAI7512789.1 hypothetical protein KC347_g2117 [Hortaea werneckii]RMY95558.1 hypothetical protein D0861_00736 [Hortaea werneckii]